MPLSTHYYVISLSERANILYEAFRDFVFDIRNGGFPVEVSERASCAADSIDQDEKLREVFRIVDRHFGDCYRNDPLNVVLIGEKDLQDIFISVTAHSNVVVGRVNGDYTRSSTRDVGRIAWAVVKEIVSGVISDAVHELETAENNGRAVRGFDAVSQAAMSGIPSKLLVEDDYHVRGSVTKTDLTLKITREVDVMGEMDDAVDIIIENALESGGKVIFLPAGSLRKHGRIASFPLESNNF